MRRLLHYDVRVGPTETEGIYACAGGPIPVRPWFQSLRNSQSKLVKRNIGIRLLEVQIGRNLSVLQHQRHLNDPRHARPGFQMSDIGFDRSDYEGASGDTVCRENCSQGLRLDWIANRSAGPVRFDILNIPWR